MTHRPFILGVTGSIGSGKTTATRFLKKRDTLVISADATVHALLKKDGKAVRPIAKLFPETVKRGGIDRRLLAARVFNDPKALEALEALLHPLVAKEEKRFIRQAQQEGKSFVVLEIPLLFETQAEDRCDATLCLLVSKKDQKERVLARPGMTEAKLRSILARQMKEKERRQKATYIVDTSKGLEETKARLAEIRQHMEELCAKLF